MTHHPTFDSKDMPFHQPNWLMKQIPFTARRWCRPLLALMPATVTRWTFRGTGAEETCSADTLNSFVCIACVCVHALLWGEHGCGNPQSFLHTPMPRLSFNGYSFRFQCMHATFCFSQSFHGQHNNPQTTKCSTTWATDPTACL